MATNDFLKFAYGVGANKISQAVYAAASWLASGFPTTGTDKTAYSNQLNKAWSQSSFWAQLLGDAIVAKLNKNVVDDGDSTGKLADFLQTMQLVGATGPVFALASAATTDLGTAEKVAGGGIASHFVQVTGAAGINSFGSTADVSRPLYFVTFTGAPLLTNSGNLLLPGAANIQAAAGDFLIAEYLGSGTWQVLMYYQARSPASSGSNANGWWEKRSSGVLEQWGYLPVSAAGALYTVTFPLTPGAGGFTNAANIVGTYFGNNFTGVGDSTSEITNITTASMDIRNTNGATSMGWRAIGRWN
jgi:hypothetical protein